MLQKHDEKNAVVGGSVNKVSFILNLDLRRGNCVTYLLQRRYSTFRICVFYIPYRNQAEKRKPEKQQSLMEQKPELKLIFFCFNSGTKPILFFRSGNLSKYFYF